MEAEQGGVASGALSSAGSEKPSWVSVTTHLGRGPIVTGGVIEAKPPNAACPKETILETLDASGDFSPPDPDGLATATELVLKHRGTGLASLAADAMALVVAAIGAAGMATLLHARVEVHAQTFVFSTTLVRLLVSVPLMALLLGGSRARWRLQTTMGEQLAAIAPALAVGALISLAGWRLVSEAGLVKPPGPDSLLIMFAAGLLTVALVRLADHSQPRGEQRHRRALVVGSGLVADRVTQQLNTSVGVEVVGFVDDDPLDATGCLGKLRDLAVMCERESVDHVVVAFSRSPSEDIIEALRPVQGQVAITVVPRLFDVLPATANLHDLGSGLTGISVAPASFGWGSRVAKRTIDLVGALVALLLLSPFLLILTIAVGATSEGSVVFRQTRVGKHKQAFAMYKFRTMRIDYSVSHPLDLGGETATGPFRKLKDDPRVTSIGRFLRRTSLDELPQLWNVVRGEMSLVGPRPFVPDDAVWITDWARRRYSVRPGLTGLWQVSGRNNLTFDEMCRLDNLYVTGWSPGLDVRIMLRTLRAVFARSGAF